MPVALSNEPPLASTLLHIYDRPYLGEPYWLRCACGPVEPEPVKTGGGKVEKHSSRHPPVGNEKDEI